jgi:hypothetical protein
MGHFNNRILFWRSISQGKVVMGKKCIVIFCSGMLVATASYAFFDKFFAVPQQMMQMGQQMVQSKCACND